MLKTRYIELSRQIEDKIVSEKWEGRLPGVFVLAEKFKVNPRTVSKAFKLLSKKGILTIQGTKGTFIVKNNSNTPKIGTIGVVGLLQADNNTPELMYMDKVAAKNNYKIIGLGYNQEILLHNASLISGVPVDGHIFTNSTLNPKIVIKLRQNGIPFVSINRMSEVDGVNWVDFDNEKAIEKSLRYLISLGHRRIAYIAYHYALEEHEKRTHNAYRRIMKDAGIFDERLYLADEYSNTRHKKYGREYRKIYGLEKIKHLMNLKRPPTAAFINDVRIAHGVYEGLKSKGIRVPEEFSIISCLQNEKMIKHEKFFTILICPSKKRAKMAVERLVVLIDNPYNPVVQKLLPQELILQKSTHSIKIKEKQSKISGKRKGGG